ncbi:MAG: hypothetical protein KME27_15860 [Lyngbya sp. HA4199-MV5]|jgi:hypothetical protein|nr:hypothetical protein [Lyngbya sp. HA4199-MV5]
MTTKTYEKSFISLKRHLADYLPQLEQAISAIRVLETTALDPEALSQALADLHVASTVLEPYFEGMREAIDQFTESRSDEA